MSMKNGLIGLSCVMSITVVALVAFNKLLPEHDCLFESQVTEIVEVRTKSVIWKSNELILQTSEKARTSFGRRQAELLAYPFFCKAKFFI